MKSIILVTTGSAKLCNYQSVQTSVALKYTLLVVMASSCFARAVERKDNLFSPVCDLRTGFLASS